MTIASVLVRARILGVNLEPENDGLRYRGRRSAVDRLLPDLEAHKSEIIALLRERPPYREGGLLEPIRCWRCKGAARLAFIAGEIACVSCVVAEARGLVT